MTDKFTRTEKKKTETEECVKTSGLIYFSGTTAISVQGYRNSNRLPVCVYMYECNFRRD